MATPDESAAQNDRPLRPIETWTHVQILHARLLQEQAAELRRHGLTPSQYSVLKCLVDHGTPGLTCSAIIERMIQSGKDVTRLLDRLSEQGLVRRRKSPEDGRVVVVTPEDAAVTLIKKLEGPLQQVLARGFSALSPGELEGFSQHLARITGVQKAQTPQDRPSA